MTSMAYSTITHPSWCADLAGCRGDHVGDPIYVSATGGDAVRVSVGDTRHPAIGIGAAHVVSEGAPPTVLVHVVGGEWDVEVWLRPDEARRHVFAIEAALAVIAYG